MATKLTRAQIAALSGVVTEKVIEARKAKINELATDPRFILMSEQISALTNELNKLREVAKSALNLKESISYYDCEHMNPQTIAEHAFPTGYFSAYSINGAVEVEITLRSINPNFDLDSFIDSLVAKFV